MANFGDALNQQINNFLCEASNAEAATTSWLNSAIRSIPGSRTPLPDPTDRAPYGAFNRRYCSDADGAFGNSPVSFQGGPTPPGQCPGVPYRIQGTAIVQNSSGQQIRALGYLTNRTGPLPRFNLQITSNNVLVVDDDGTTLANLGNRPSGAASAEWANGYPTVTRRDGLPNEACDAGSNAPATPTGSGDLTYDDVNGTPVTEPIDIVGGSPSIDIDGNFFVPLEVCFAAICLDVNANLSTGDIAINFGGEPGASNCCPPPGDVPEDGNEDDPPPPDDPVRYIGVITRASLNGEACAATEIGDGNGPNLFIPRIGVIRFAIAIGGRRSYTVDQPIKQLHQVTYVNAPSVAYDWVILPDKGFDITGTGVPVVE